MSSCLSQLKDSSLFRTEALVNGEWIQAKSGNTFVVHNPATGEKIGTAPEFNVEDAANAVEKAHNAFEEWKKSLPHERSRLLRAWYNLIQQHHEDLATILTLENGKSYKESLSEVEYGASFVEWFSEEAKRIYGDVIPNTKRHQRTLVIRQPVGVCSILTPWNFPNGMITRKVGAALAAGCTVVIKPPCETPYSALALGELAQRAGFPPGVVNVITTDKHLVDVGRELCVHPLVRKVSFTGSTNIGKLIMKQCSEGMKKISLELGGNSPFIIFDDADLELTVKELMKAKFLNGGQTCISPNRIYVQRGIHDQFVEALSKEVNALRAGDGFDDSHHYGPLISQRAVEKVKRHIDDAVKRGARVVASGSLDESEQHKQGFFVQATLLTEVTDKDALVAKEETFGPLLAVRPFETEEEVIESANKAEVGLGSYLFTKDHGRIFRVSEALEVGMVGVNSSEIMSDVNPFGGVKGSGMGREGSKYGLDEYVELKQITIGI